MATVTLRPNSDEGDNGSVTASTGSTYYGCVDETSLDTGDYITCLPFGGRCQFGFTSSGLTNETEISVKAWVNTDASGNKSFTDANIDTHVAVSEGSNWYSYTFTKNPLDDEDWEVADLTSLNIGFAVDDEDAKDSPLVYMFYVVVTYTESSGTSANSERGLYIQGKDTSTSQRGLYISGGGVLNSERGLYLSGKVAESSERGLYLQGEITTDSERGLYLEGYVSDLFTRESASDLESDDANLTTVFSEQEYTDVGTDDDDFVDLEGNGVYQKFLFKEYNEDNNNTDNFVITWKGKTTLAPSDSSVYLQIYNRDTPSWETIDTESSANANTEFTLSGIKTTSLSDYYDEDYVVNCRVYQGGA